jgi:hypothetical protein
MNRILMVVAVSLMSWSCAARYEIKYTPNPNVHEPEKVVERYLKTQPSNYTSPPYYVAFTDDCVMMGMTDPKGWSVFGGSSGDVQTSLCYKNIGWLTLNKSGIWYVTVYDRQGYWVHYLWSSDIESAQRFIDAMYTLMKRNGYTPIK